MPFQSMTLARGMTSLNPYDRILSSSPGWQISGRCWHQGLRHRIEMVGMQMRDDDEFDAVEDFFRANRQFDQRVRRTPGEGWSRSLRGKEWIDQDDPAADLQ